MLPGLEDSRSRLLWKLHEPVEHLSVRHPAADEKMDRNWSAGRLLHRPEGLDRPIPLDVDQFVTLINAHCRILRGALLNVSCRKAAETRTD
jgi:hypothetical protein